MTPAHSVGRVPPTGRSEGATSTVPETFHALPVQQAVNRLLRAPWLVRQTVYITVTRGTSKTWQARISHDLAEQLRGDAELLGLDGRTEIVKAALHLLHRRAAEEPMARSVDDFYGDHDVPSPIGVRPARPNTRPDVTA